MVERQAACTGVPHSRLDGRLCGSAEETYNVQAKPLSTRASCAVLFSMRYQTMTQMTTENAIVDHSNNHHPSRLWSLSARGEGCCLCGAVAWELLDVHALEWYGNLYKDGGKPSR